MKHLRALLKKDAVLGVKDVWILLEIGFAVVVSLALVLVVPDSIEREGTVYVYDETSVLESWVEANAAEEVARKGEYYVGSRDEVVAGMTEDRGAVGLLVTSRSPGTFHIELLTQPYTSPALVRYVETELEDLFSIIAPPAGAYTADVYEHLTIRAQQLGVRDELPFDQRLLPPIALMMVGMVGLFAMVSLVSQERSEGTLRAYNVAPAGLGAFLTSKHLIMLGISLITFSVLYLPLMGFAGYLPALLIVALTVIMGSALGVLLGTFYDNPMASIGWIFVVLLVLGLPAISYFTPAFSPGWLQLIPSYHTLFGLDAAMFPDNNAAQFWRAAGVLAIIDVMLLLLTSGLFTTRIRREATA